MRKIMIIFVGLLLGACQKDNVDTYESGKYIYFTKASTTDSVNFSFFFYPGENSLKIPVVISYAGMGLTRDCSYELLLDEEASVVDPANYDIPKNLSFKAGSFRDTIEIKIHKTVALDQSSMRLVLKIVENEFFQVGPPANRQSVIRFTAKAVKPTWWDKAMVDSYLGEYSDTKYSKFIEVTGISDLGGMNAGQVRYHTLKFKYYLQEMSDAGTPVMDGVKEMSVTILG